MTTMHYWPVGGPAFACNADNGFRTSMRDAVTCVACRATFAPNPINDRRHNARVAYYDSAAKTGGIEGSAIALEAAIETATRVRITPEIIAGFRGSAGNYERGLCAAFAAAGFEVED